MRKGYSMEESGIRGLLADLGNGDKPLLSSSLADLSNLNTGELGSFEQLWVTIETSRRRKIIDRLLELAENNFELNFDDIFKMALKDKDPDVRTKAIGGLWEDEEPLLINSFVRLLKEDSSEKVQSAAAAALGRFAMMAELRKLRPSYAATVTEALLSVLADRSKPAEVRRRVLESAAPLTIPRVKEAITDAYNSPDMKLKASAVYAMGRSCDPAWLPILLNELFNGSPEIRYEAINACGELCDKEAVPQLMKLLDDKDVDVQLAAIQALGKIGGAQAKRCLQRCLESPDDSVCQAAEEALRELEAEDSSLL